MLTRAIYGRRSVPAKQEFKPHEISQPAKQVMERVSAGLMNARLNYYKKDGKKVI